MIMTRKEYMDELRAGVTNYALTVKQAIEAAYKHADETNPNGWRPASELPPVGENGNSTDIIAIDEDNEPIKVSYNKFHNCWVLDGATAESFDKITIKWWCYPPEEE